MNLALEASNHIHVAAHKPNLRLNSTQPSAHIDKHIYNYPDYIRATLDGNAIQFSDYSLIVVYISYRISLWLACLKVCSFSVHVQLR